MCSQSTHARSTGNVTLHPLLILPHPGEMDDSSGVDSDSDLFELIVLLALKRRRKKRKRHRRCWVRPIFQRRREQGDYHNLIQEMRPSDLQSHFQYVRMSKERFDSLLAKVSTSMLFFTFKNHCCRLCSYSKVLVLIQSYGSFPFLLIGWSTNIPSNI